MISVWRWLASLFDTGAPSTLSGPGTVPDDIDPALLGMQAVDAAARNALLEIHFGELKIRRRTPRRLSGLSTLNQ